MVLGEELPGNDVDGEHDPQSEQQIPLLQRDLDKTPIYPIIQLIREDICHYVDAPLKYEAMLGPDLTYSLTRPLQEKYFALQQAGNRAIVFALLINRVYFIRDTSFSTRSLSNTRAALCEILATRVLRENDNLLDLAIVMTTSWLVFSGASDEVRKMADMQEGHGEDERVGNAIEIAILGKAKRFIKSSACQKVINAIWSGRCVYQADSSHSILSDTYKRRHVQFYDPHKAPLLDHYRLKVPAVRSVLEYINFLLLFVLFVIALEYGDQNKLNAAEMVFMAYALGFSLEKLAAMQEHGIRVYINGTWNGFDMLFVTIFITYISFRTYGLKWDSQWARTMGTDSLALVAVLIFPRLAFATLSSNLMILALRSLVIEFVMLMSLACFCFTGFLYALWTLSRNEGREYSAGQIAWWMLDLWFGLDASGFDRAGTFHPIFGPMLMVTYACLSNTLLLTVLVSILSYTFSTISEDMVAEAMYRRAVYTIEGVKADALFSYQPPLNLAALALMLPASYILTPRWFHKVNVFMIRLTNFPILIIVAFWERQTVRAHATTFYETVTDVAERFYDSLPRPIKRLSFFEGFMGLGGEIDIIFEIEDEINERDFAEDSQENLHMPNHHHPAKMRRRHSSVYGEPDHARGSSFPKIDTSQHSPKQLKAPLSSPPRQVDSANHLSARQRFENRVRRQSVANPSPLAQMYGMIPQIEVEEVAGGDTLAPLPGDMQPQSPVETNLRRRRTSSAAYAARFLTTPDNVPAVMQPRLSTGAMPASYPFPVQRSDFLDPETVQEVLDSDESSPDHHDIASRLEDVEKSQQKIENLLQRLLDRFDRRQSYES